MSFIRVTDKETAIKVDLNTAHIMGFRPADLGEGSVITMINGGSYSVTDTVRSLRGYVKKAQGTLPEPSSVAEPATA